MGNNVGNTGYGPYHRDLRMPGKRDCLGDGESLRVSEQVSHLMRTVIKKSIL